MLSAHYLTDFYFQGRFLPARPLKPARWFPAAYPIATLHALPMAVTDHKIARVVAPQLSPAAANRDAGPPRPRG